VCRRTRRGPARSLAGSCRALAFLLALVPLAQESVSLLPSSASGHALSLQAPRARLGFLTLQLPHWPSRAASPPLGALHSALRAAGQCSQQARRSAPAEAPQLAVWRPGGDHGTRWLPLGGAALGRLARVALRMRPWFVESSREEVSNGDEDAAPAGGAEDAAGEARADDAADAVSGDDEEEWWDESGSGDMFSDSLVLPEPPPPPALGSAHCSLTAHL